MCGDGGWMDGVAMTLLQYDVIHSWIAMAEMIGPHIRQQFDVARVKYRENER